MPTFPAPRPVAVVIDQTAGTVQIEATDRADAVVTIEPANPARTADVRAAQEFTATLANDVLTVSGPTSLRKLVTGPKGSVVVTIQVPGGSALSGKLAAGPLDTQGPLGAVTFTASAGNVSIDHASRLELRAAAGNVVVGRVAGMLDVRASAGSVRIREVIGEGHVKASAGDTTVGRVDGSLTVQAAYGEITVGEVHGTVDARTGTGGIRVDALASGAATLTTAHGSIEVGVPEGTAAWVDASTGFGHVRNRLTAAEGPGRDGAPTAEIHASTKFGDILVRRPEATVPHR